MNCRSQNLKMACIWIYGQRKSNPLYGTENATMLVHKDQNRDSKKENELQKQCTGANEGWNTQGIPFSSDDTYQQSFPFL